MYGTPIVAYVKNPAVNNKNNTGDQAPPGTEPHTPLSHHTQVGSPHTAIQIFTKSSAKWSRTNGHSESGGYMKQRGEIRTEISCNAC